MSSNPGDVTQSSFGANFTCPAGLIVRVTADDLNAAASVTDDDGGSNLWVLGVILSIIVTFLSALGGFLIKYAYNLVQRDQADPLAKPNMETAKPYPKLLFFCGNMSIAGLGPLLDIAALTMAAQSLIIPIAGLTIVWNFLLATFALKERWNKWNVTSMILICAGVAVIAIFGSHDSSNKELPVILCLFHNLAFVIYFLLFLIGAVICTIGWKHPKSPARIRPICAAILPGAIGGNQFFIKAVGEMVVLAFDGITYWSNPGAYLISLTGIGFAIGQLVMLNKALRDYDALLVVPLYQAALILTGSVSGGIFFIEFDALDAKGWAGYFTGLLAVLGGVGIVFLQPKEEEVVRNNMDQSLDIPKGHPRSGGSFDNPLV